jgi:hypothetical protein
MCLSLRRICYWFAKNKRFCGDPAAKPQLLLHCILSILIIVVVVVVVGVDGGLVYGESAATHQRGNFASTEKGLSRRSGALRGSGRALGGSGRALGSDCRAKCGRGLRFKGGDPAFLLAFLHLPSGCSFGGEVFSCLQTLLHSGLLGLNRRLRTISDIHAR